MKFKTTEGTQALKQKNEAKLESMFNDLVEFIKLDCTKTQKTRMAIKMLRKAHALLEVK